MALYYLGRNRLVFTGPLREASVQDTHAQVAVVEERPGSSSRYLSGGVLYDGGHVDADA